jgi:nucleoside-diphosphate-sugar epimerase
MKVLLAGASGALGIPLTRRLIEHGHEVLRLTRRPQNGGRLAALATPVIADALDRNALLGALDGYSADAVIHELTALRKPPTRHSGMVPTDRLRTEGTTNLLAAAANLGAKRFLTQSIILGYGYRDHGDLVLTEGAPFGLPEGDACDPHLAAMRSAEQQAFSAPEGIALRYGMLYGADAAQMRTLLAKRKLPVAKGGQLGWIHHEDAAAATVAALEHGRAGQAYNVVDDLPATWQEVFTAMAKAFGAPSPWKLPAWLFRLAAPYVASFAVGTSMRVSNAKARKELDWYPAFRTYRDGISSMASAHPQSTAGNASQAGAV